MEKDSIILTRSDNKYKELIDLCKTYPGECLLHQSIGRGRLHACI